MRAKDVDDELTGPLAVGITLAAVAGFLDAHLFLNVAEVFVANMSGNIVLFGMGIGRRDAGEVLGSGSALLLFVVGMGLATWVHARRRRQGQRLRPDLLVVAEILLLAGLASMLAVLDADGGHHEGLTYAAISLGALAMGLQTAVLRRVGSVAVATTYESGSVARLGEETALAGRAESAEDRVRQRRTAAVLCAMIGSYAGGAAGAAALGSSPWLIAVPVAALVGVTAALAGRRTRT